MSRVHLLFVVALTTLIVTSHGKPAAHEKDTEVKDLLQALKRFLGEKETNIEATVAPTQANDDDVEEEEEGSGRAASAPNVDLKITVDNVLTALYINGQRVPQSQLPNYNNWQAVDTVSIPAETQVIAISAHDDGVVAGILASVGSSVTNSISWRCVPQSSSIPSTWMNVDFDDSAWPQAVTVSNNPDKWHNQISAISSSAQWIWTSRFLQGDVDADVLCRGRIRCPAGFTYLESVRGCYQVVFANLEWEMAGVRCKRLNKDAHLVVINNNEEQTAVASMMTSLPASSFSPCLDYGGGNIAGTPFWTAGQRIDPTRFTSPFVWRVKHVNKGGCDVVTEMTYTGWASGEPNNSSPDGGEACVQMARGRSYAWNDGVCTRAFCSICEIDV